MFVGAALAAALEQLSAGMEEETVIGRRRAARTGSRHWGPLCPYAGRGIEHVVRRHIHTETAVATATADNVNALIEHDNAEMVARHRERRGAAPSVGGRVVNFMRGNNILIGVTAADGVSFEPDDFFCLPRTEERYY